MPENSANFAPASEASEPETLEMDWERFDREEPKEVEYEDIPELDDDFFEPADPNETHPLKRGRPRLPAVKGAINIRLSPAVLDYFRSGGPGWQTRIDNVLLTHVTRVKRGD